MKIVGRFEDGQLQEKRELADEAAQNLIRKGWREIIETPQPVPSHPFSVIVQDAGLLEVDGVHVRQWQEIQRDEPSRIVAIDTFAGIYIESRFPDYQQRNWIARHQELVEIKADGGTWSEAEAAEAALLKLSWTWVKAVRAHAKALRENAALQPDWPAVPQALIPYFQVGDV